MPSAEEIYEGKRERVFSLLRVILEVSGPLLEDIACVAAGLRSMHEMHLQVYVLRSMRRRNRDLIQWLAKILTPYSTEIPGGLHVQPRIRAHMSW